jgi:hypothetical protein
MMHRNESLFQLQKELNTKDERETALRRMLNRKLDKGIVFHLRSRVIPNEESGFTKSTDFVARNWNELSPVFCW